MPANQLEVYHLAAGGGRVHNIASRLRRKLRRG